MRPLYSFGLALALAACIGDPAEPPPVMPPGSIVFTFEPTALTYTFLDSTVTPPFRLDWLAPNFSGFNCVGLLPSSPADTAHGTFTFSWSGDNVGLVQRSNTIDMDTVFGYFLPEDRKPTQGSYSIDGNGVITVSWNDGNPTRYFDPAGTLRLSADSVISDVVLKTRGDSVQEIWRVAWIFSGGTGC